MAAAFAASPAPKPEKADRIVVLKSERKLMLMRGERVLREYKVALGGQPVGKKTRHGDHKTPEGRYRIDARNDHSKFYRALHISYPNKNDIARARKLGMNPGGNIVIHGLPAGFEDVGEMHTVRDWTKGCIAVTNEEMDEICNYVTAGTSIEIRP